MRIHLVILTFAAFMSYNCFAKHEDKIHLFEAKYKVYWHDILVGNYASCIEKSNSGGFRVYTGMTPVLFQNTFEMFEQSEFDLDKHGNILPKRFRSHKKEKNKVEEYEHNFDANKKKICVNKQQEIEFTPNIQDELSQFQQLRLDIMAKKLKPKYVYKVLYKNEPCDYTYEHLGTDKVIAAATEFTTHKFKQSTNHNNRTTYIWIAPNLNYSIVRLEQYKNDKKLFEIIISEYT